MDQLVGTWRSEGRVIGGGEHEGDLWRGFDVYEWFPGEQHMVHRVDVDIFGGRKEAMEFFTPRASSSDSFDQTSFDADGTIERGVGSFDAQGRYHNDADGARAVVTFHDRHSMSAHWELRQPDGSWAEWMDVSFTRIAEPHIEVQSKRDHQHSRSVGKS
jgi:hypothetical protein